MSSCLLHSYDFKLLFDSLAESNGRVLLDTLSRHWPDDDNLPSHLPKDCMGYWRLSTSQDGSLTWKGFSSALMEAFMGDRHRLSGDSSRKAEEPDPVGVFTTTKDIEDELASCSKDKIASALARTRKEVYKSQKSINNFTSPRKENNTGGNHAVLNASHQMRDEVILQQLEDLLRDRIKEQSTTAGGGMVDEVLRQLRSLLMSSRVGAHDQLQYNNPYATIRRGSTPISKGGNKTTRHSISDQMLIGQPVNRSLSMPGSRPLNILPEPPPPYSVAAPPQQLYSKRNSASMSNLRPQQPPTMDPTHANSTRQLLHVWKEANISTAGARKAPSAHIRPYVSSPDLSQEELQFTSEELRQAEMYGTITRRKSNKRSSAQHQQQVMTSSRTDMLLDPPLPPSSRQPAAAPEKQTVQPHSTPSK